MEPPASPVPNFCSCSSFQKTFDSIYSWLPFGGESTSVKTEEVNYKKFVLSEAINTYPFSSTYIYCRFSNRETDTRMKDSSKRMAQSEIKTEDDPLRNGLPSVRSLLTLGICVIYTTVLFIAAAAGSRLLSSLKTIVKYSLRFILSTRLKSTRQIKEFAPRHSGT
ncbi:uncharacterized protein LOC121389560 [Gigantopelta aegis]|uniref:uncharacterized protein LOC121389560 n=1 Tax=Gigantopelta aegis TaxID=1735272 RepID=UPI001B88E689|nr:uncharacterized protein LOC121389560 [Gigantopelta aegis]